MISTAALVSVLLRLLATIVPLAPSRSSGCARGTYRVIAFGKVSASGAVIAIAGGPGEPCKDDNPAIEPGSGAPQTGCRFGPGTLRFGGAPPRLRCHAGSDAVRQSPCFRPLIVAGVVERPPTELRQRALNFYELAADAAAMAARIGGPGALLLVDMGCRLLYRPVTSFRSGCLTRYRRHATWPGQIRRQSVSRLARELIL